MGRVDLKNGDHGSELITLEAQVFSGRTRVQLLLVWPTPCLIVGVVRQQSFESIEVVALDEHVRGVFVSIGKLGDRLK